jgi:hypothetical protein
MPQLFRIESQIFWLDLVLPLHFHSGVYGHDVAPASHRRHDHVTLPSLSTNRRTASRNTAAPGRARARGLGRLREAPLAKFDYHAR